VPTSTFPESLSNQTKIFAFGDMLLGRGLNPRLENPIAMPCASTALSNRVAVRPWRAAGKGQLSIDLDFR
jgi:hypothetical protein